MRPDAGTVAAYSERLKRLYTAAAYDIMDEMGLSNQCLDLAIKPLDRNWRVAGPAFTMAGSADPRSDAEYDDLQEVKDLTFFRRMYAGCIVVISAAGETRAGHWGELMSTAAKAAGATGVVIDGGCRDGNIIAGMSGWSVFARYLSPIESKQRFRYKALEKPVAMAGSLTSQVRVDPGDWIFGDMDGVVVIPAGKLETVVAKAEAMCALEDRTRVAIAGGMDVKDAFDRFGRL